MHRHAAAILLGTALLAFPGSLAGQEQRLTDDQIRDILIRQSIARYSGPCPCPYSTMRNGRKCAGNSAWSKPGGASPLCYRNDVNAARVAAYRLLERK